MWILSAQSGTTFDLEISLEFDTSNSGEEERDIREDVIIEASNGIQGLIQYYGSSKKRESSNLDAYVGYALDKKILFKNVFFK